MNPSFSIKSTVTATDAHLFVHAGKQGIASAVLNRQQNMFTDVRVYHFNNDADGHEWQRLLRQVLENEESFQQFFSKTDIVWSTAESIITPQAYFNREQSAAMLELVFGDAGEYVVKNELLLKQQAYNVYRVDKMADELLGAKFSAGMQSHQSSLLINLMSDSPGLLYCNFFPGSVTVMLRVQGQLQTIQTYHYNTPEDAAYYLLNTCQRFNVDAGDTVITASGMIDAASNLYKELYKYFLRIDFCELPETFSYSDEIKTYPAHYFSHLFATAACVL